MTRRKSVGRITYVSAGPGDPGLLTQRALASLSVADDLVCDAGQPEELISAARQAAPDEAQLRTAQGSASEIAATLVESAQAGRVVIRLVRGDAFTNAAVVREVHELSESAVPFEVLPGVTHAEGVATYAGTPLGNVRTIVDIADVASVDFDALVSAPGSLVITVDAGELGTVRDGLIKAGMERATPVSVSGEGTTEIQSTSSSTIDALVDIAVGLFGRLVVTVGDGVSQRDKLGWWESRPLYGWKVLVPRTKEQAGTMSAGLREWGAIPTEVPTIAVEPPRTPAQMERAIKGLVDGRYAWVVFTSANAVRAIWEKFDEHGLDARHFGGVKIACIGEATADAVRSFGIQPELLPEHEQSSVGLLESFPPFDSVLDPINRVLLPRADIATETLAAGLVERAWEVDDVTAYRTVRAAPPPAEIRDAIKSGGFDAVLFTSSSTVRNLVGIAGKPHARTVIACIGPKTAETAQELGLRVDVQPETADVASLVEGLADFAVELREKMANMTTKPRRGAKIQGPTAGRHGMR